MGQVTERNYNLTIYDFFRELEGKLFKTHAQMYHAIQAVQIKYLSILPAEYDTKDYIDFAKERGWIKCKGILEIIVDDGRGR